jgi:hypothetical protein
MKKLKNFCEKIAFICRVRYEVYTSECPNSDEICEQLDESIYVIYQNMETIFSLNKENLELFLRFFWECLKETEEWQMSVEKFGKDFDYTKDFLEQCFNNICQ